MADPPAYTFTTSAGEQRSINPKDLVAVIPNSDGPHSTIIYVQHDNQDDTAPPKAIIVQGDAQPTVHPQNTSDEETHIIISTQSGTGKAQLFHQQVLSPVLETLFPRGHANFLTHYTASATTIQELTQDIFFPTANAGISLRIILLSGDGGVTDLLNGLLLGGRRGGEYKAPQVVLVPLGTANALYHSTTAGKDNTWGLRTLCSTTSAPLPTFTARFSPGARLLVNEGQDEEPLPKDSTGTPVLHGAVVASWGMHASLVADSDTAAYRKFGIDRFKMAAKESLYPADGSPPHAYRGRVSYWHAAQSPSHVMHQTQNRWRARGGGEHGYVLATAVERLEKKFCISPETKPLHERTKTLDGRMKLVHFGPTTGDEAMRIMNLAYDGGKHVDDDKVTYMPFDGLKIEFEEKEARWRRVCIDGKIVRVEEGGGMEVWREERSVGRKNGEEVVMIKERGVLDIVVGGAEVNGS